MYGTAHAGIVSIDTKNSEQKIYLEKLVKRTSNCKILLLYTTFQDEINVKPILKYLLFSDVEISLLQFDLNFLDEDWSPSTLFRLPNLWDETKRKFIGVINFSED